MDDAITMALSILEEAAVETTGSYNNGVIDVPAKQSEVVTVDKDNVVKELIDSGYYEASQFTGLDAATEPVSGSIPVGIVLPTKDEPRWIQDQTPL